ncbi:MAG: hypothetical protein CMF12_08415 [Idiomarina sp.]|uniref:hypothetical protein n=1 Tax=Idiomarina sp. TaxID=1874361 RepID=UPI000C654F24|nr:hypothetical protein [Idiomarina sp.]MBT42532.1 hypothetical protein [Idiomarina sp.]
MKKTLLAIVPAAVLLSACSSSPDVDPEQAMNQRLMELEAQQREMQKIRNAHEQEIRVREIEALPEWVEAPPDADGTGFYGVGIAQSKNLNHSRKSARLQAEMELAKQSYQELSASERAFEQGNGDGDVTVQTTFLIDNIIDTVPVVGYQVVDQKIQAMDGQVYTYVLLKLPYAQFNMALQQQRESSEDKRIQSHFDDLERRLAKRRAEKEKAAEAEHQRDIERMEARAEFLKSSESTDQKTKSPNPGL